MNIIYKTPTCGKRASLAVLAATGLIALVGCSSASTVESTPSEPVTQLQTLYTYYVDTLTPCLEAQGLTVDPPPSLQVFVQDDANNKTWTPYNGIEPQSQEQWIELNNLCPQVPANLYTQ